MDANRNCNRNNPGRCFYNQGTTVKYTGQTCTSQTSNREDIGSRRDQGEKSMRPVGMAYIPAQPFDNLYDAKCGLMEGTMFKDLNLIFCGVRRKQS